VKPSALSSGFVVVFVCGNSAKMAAKA